MKITDVKVVPVNKFLFVKVMTVSYTHLTLPTIA